QLFLAAVFLCQHNFSRSDHLADSKKPGDVVLFHQEFKPLCELSDDAFFSLHHPSQIKADIFEFQTVSSCLVPGEIVMIGRQQKRLAWDATDVKAGAAQNFAFVDNRCINAELSGANCSGISG